MRAPSRLTESLAREAPQVLRNHAVADLIDMAKSLPEDWDPVGLEPNRRMLDEFARQQYLQKLTPVQRDADFLFPVKTI
mgnify:CR=1 FL=1